jgi:toxin YoeB
VRVHFTSHGWEDYQYWLENDPAMLARVNSLIRYARRNPLAGLGKPEPLKRQLAGWWSRRISGEHRLVYRVAGKAGIDQRLEILMCRNHYE